jgi:predicted MPP superfamily phosphohydrolase
MARLIIYFLLALSIAALLNLVPMRALLAMFPRVRRPLFAIAAVANVMWLFFPFLNHMPSSELTRIVRATLGPLWCGWTLFLLIEWLFLVPLVFFWLPFARRRTFFQFARPFVAVQLVVFSLLAAVGFYQAIVPIRTEVVPITIANLPPQLRGLRIALLSDLHVGYFSRTSRLEQFTQTALSLKPDLVLVSGDLVDDDPYFVPKLLKGFSALPPTTPLLSVPGNHEMYGDPRAVIAALRNSRMRLLVNENHLFERNGAKLYIVGLSDYAARRDSLNADLAPDLKRASTGIPPGAMRILLAHQPLAFAEARRAHIPLTLVGHTHGGQCGIRKLHWTVAGIFLPFDMGYYRRGDAQLYVNTGTGFWMLPFRLGMTPEVTLVELR